MGHYQQDMLAKLNNNDLFGALDVLGRAGKMDNAKGAWEDYQKLKAAFDAALAAGTPADQAFPPFKNGVLQIIHDHTHQTPGIGHLIGSVAGGLGHFVHDAVSEAGKISKFIKKIPMLSTLINTAINIIPGVASVRTAISGIVEAAGDIIKADELLSAAKTFIPADAQEGFKVGAGLMSQKGITPEVFHAIQQTLPPNEQKGFDMAVSLAIGKSKNNAPKGLSKAQQASYYITHGMVNATPDMRASMMTPIAADPHVAEGAKAAATEIKTRESFWHHILRVLHLLPKDTTQVTTPAGH